MQQTKQQADNDGRWNFAVSLWDEIFIFFGISLVSREAVMPVLVSQLTDSKLAIGLIPAIFSLGMYLPQLLVANFSERLRYKKPFVMLASGPGERGAYLLMALTIWGLAERSPTLTLVLFFLLLAISAVCIGIAMPAWFDMIAKVIPLHRRGVLFGVGRGSGALLGVGGAFLVGQGWGEGELPAILLDLITTGDPTRQQRLMRRVAALLHERGVPPRL